MPKDILCVGNAIVDCVARIDEVGLEDTDLVKGSMRLLSHDEAQALERRVAAAGIWTSGGSAGNTAAGIAALGGEVAFLGRVADDDLGRRFAADLRDGGVGSHLKVGPTDPGTGRSFVLVTPDAERTMCTYLGASVTLDALDLSSEMFEGASLAHLEAYFLDAPRAARALNQALTFAGVTGTEVSLTLSSASCVSRWREGILDLVRQAGIDVVLGNREEWETLADARYGVEAFMAQLPATCVMTDGAKGAIGVSGGQVSLVPGRRVERIVDTTGAGDAFAAGYLVGHVRGMAITERLALGCATAAEAVTRVGARPPGAR